MELTILSIEGNHALIERPMDSGDGGRVSRNYVDRDDARQVIVERWELGELPSCDCCAKPTTDLVKVEDPSNPGHHEWRCAECRQ